MYVRQIELKGFRNYREAELQLAGGVVVVHGANGAGKSNLLEAIGLAAVGEPFRARDTEELVRQGEDYGLVRARFGVKDREVMVEVGLARRGAPGRARSGRRFKIGGVERRRAELIGLAPVVYFSADDIGMVRGEPGGRRRMMDLALAAVSRPYYQHLTRYRRGLEQRNRLLKEIRDGRERAETLVGWDRALARYGARLMVERAAFAAGLAGPAGRAHEVISGGGREFMVEYRPSVELPSEQTPGDVEKNRTDGVEEVADALVEAWRRRREAEIGAGTTLVGPHRDDLGLLLGGKEVRGFASQGEQRSCALALRVGLAERMKEMTGEMPALLLDDVLSELDEGRRAGVFAAAGGAEQVVITCCDVRDVPGEILGRAQVVEIVEGVVASGG